MILLFKASLIIFFKNKKNKSEVWWLNLGKRFCWNLQAISHHSCLCIWSIELAQGWKVPVLFLIILIWRLSSEQRKMCFRFSLLTYIDLLTSGIDKATTDTFFPTWLPVLAAFHNCVKGALDSAAGAFFPPSPTGYVLVCPWLFWKMTNKFLTLHWKMGMSVHIIHNYRRMHCGVIFSESVAPEAPTPSWNVEWVVLVTVWKPWKYKRKRKIKCHLSMCTLIILMLFFYNSNQG